MAMRRLPLPPSRHAADRVARAARARVAVRLDPIVDEVVAGIRAGLEAKVLPDDVREALTLARARAEAAAGTGSDASSGSLLSIASTGSILSLGSAGSILSIGSAGSFLSLGSVGSIASVGSVFSAASFLSVGSFRGNRSVAHRPGRDAPVVRLATAMAWAALGTAVLDTVAPHSTRRRSAS